MMLLSAPSTPACLLGERPLRSASHSTKRSIAPVRPRQTLTSPLPSTYFLPRPWLSIYPCRAQPEEITGGYNQCCESPQTRCYREGQDRQNDRIPRTVSALDFPAPVSARCGECLSQGRAYEGCQLAIDAAAFY